MVLRAFVIFNLAIGVTYGAFGVLVTPIEARMNVDRSTVSFAISLIILANGLLSPFLGWLIAQFTIRRLMLFGAVWTALGYIGLGYARDATEMLLCYGLFIGPGITVMGPIPCYTLVSNWYREGQGRALGLVGMPIIAMAVPMMVVYLLPATDFRTVAYVLAGCYLLALPVIFGVIDKPSQVGQLANGQSPDEVAQDRTRNSTISTMALLCSPAFLLLVAGSGLLVGAGVGKTAHMVPLLMEAGWDYAKAALLLSVSSGTAMLGSVMFGWLADKMNSCIALTFNALLQAAVWIILIIPASYPLLVVDAMLIGACSGGFIAAKGVLVSRIYGPQNFAMVMGISGFATLPFMFGMAPLAGMLREWTGDYDLAVQIYIGGFLLAAACFALLARVERQAPTRPTGPVVATT